MQVHSSGKQTDQIGKISVTLRTRESMRELQKCIEPLFLELLFLKEHLLFSQTSLVYKTPAKTQNTQSNDSNIQTNLHC